MHVPAVVTSPTFTLINEYHGRLPVFHFDFYRMNSTLELFDLGIEEYFEKSGICLIEWPEIIRDIVPQEHIRLFLDMEYKAGLQDQRKVKLERIT